MNKLSWNRPSDFKETWANFVLGKLVTNKNYWKDGWMDRWMDGWMGGWTDRIKGDKRKCNEIFVLGKPRITDNRQIRLFQERALGMCM